jgi:hypothetical protein
MQKRYLIDSKPFTIKKTQKTRKRRESPQHDKGCEKHTTYIKFRNKMAAFIALCNMILEGLARATRQEKKLFKLKSYLKQIAFFQKQRTGK